MPPVELFLNHVILTLVEGGFDSLSTLFSSVKHSFKQYAIVLRGQPATFKEFEERPPSLELFKFICLKSVLVQTDQHFCLQIVLLEPGCCLLLVSKSLCKPVLDLPVLQSPSYLELPDFLLALVNELPASLSPIQEKAVEVFNFTCLEVLLSQRLLSMGHLAY